MFVILRFLHQFVGQSKFLCKFVLKFVNIFEKLRIKRREFK